MRIKEIVIVPSSPYSNVIYFRDALDVVYNLPGRRFRYVAATSLERLRRIIFNNCWPVDIDFHNNWLTVFTDAALPS